LAALFGGSLASSLAHPELRKEKADLAVGL
jgi:hypothetical protein